MCVNVSAISSLVSNQTQPAAVAELSDLHLHLYSQECITLQAVLFTVFSAFCMIFCYLVLTATPTLAPANCVSLPSVRRVSTPWHETCFTLLLAHWQSSWLLGPTTIN